MRKFGIAFMVFVLMMLTITGLLSVNAANALEDNPGNNTVQLTEAQKKELATLHKDILEKRKEVISKYVEYGVITKEKGDKKISQLEKHYEKLEENGFINLKCHKSKKGKSGNS